MKISPHILLLGGGYTLSRLAQMLDPHSFVITSTTPAKVAQFKSKGYHSAFAEISSLDSISEIFNKYPALTAIIDSVPPTKDKFSEDVSAFCNKIRMSLKKVIYLSTTGVFGVDDGSWVNEETPSNPKNPRAQTRAEIENVYLQSDIESVSIFRLPAIYGPGRGIGTALRNKTYKLIGDGSNWSNRIHVDDLCQILKIGLEIDRPPKILCVADDFPAPTIDVVNYYCEKFNLDLPESQSKEDALLKGNYSRTSNQRILNTLLHQLFKVKLHYPSFKEGASTEFV